MAEVEPADSGVRLAFDAQEADVLRGLVAQLRGVLRSGERDDPVLHRLAPAAYEDPTEEEKYRELVGDSLEQHTLEMLASLTSALGTHGSARMELGPQDAERWLAAITNLRLALGTRLDVDEERMGAELDPSDPQAGPMAVLHWLGWLQESLLRALGSAGL